jgi:hypothetical protein
MASTETEDSEVLTESDQDDSDTSSMHSADSSSEATDEDSQMEFITWDAASASSTQSLGGSPQPPSHSINVRDTLWRWLPYTPHANDKILCFKLASEESNLLAVLTRWVESLHLCMHSRCINFLDWGCRIKRSSLFASIPLWRPPSFCI